MDFTYDATVTGQQRQWIRDTISRSSYPFDDVPVAVTFAVVAEPPCEGHKDIMCTTDNGDGTYTVHIRDGIDNPSGRVAQGLPRPARDIKHFFQESVMHELGHVAAFFMLATDDAKTTVAAYFEREGATGDGYPVGTLDDWSDVLLPWEDRISEAVAETVKDASLDSRHRIFDNRTNWFLQRAHWEDFITAIAPGAGGSWVTPPNETVDITIPLALKANVATDDPLYHDGTTPSVVGGSFTDTNGPGAPMTASPPVARRSFVYEGRSDPLTIGGDGFYMYLLDWDIEWAGQGPPLHLSFAATRDLADLPIAGGWDISRDVSGEVTPPGATYPADLKDLGRWASNAPGNIHGTVTNVNTDWWYGDSPIDGTLWYTKDPAVAAANAWYIGPFADSTGGVADLVNTVPPGVADTPTGYTIQAAVGALAMGLTMHNPTVRIVGVYNPVFVPGGSEWNPEWPYEDPTISGHQGATGVMRLG